MIKWLLLALPKPDLTYFPILCSGSVPVLEVEKVKEEKGIVTNGALAQAIVPAVNRLGKAHKLLKFVNKLYKIMFL